MRIPAPLLCFALAACGGGGGNGDGAAPDAADARSAPIACASLPLEGRYVTVEAKGCHGCTIYNEKQAADGDLATFATARIPATAEGPLRLRAGNLGGNPEPAAAAGAVIQVTQGRVDYEQELALLITLRGTPQASTLGFKPRVAQHGPLQRVSFEAPVAFDELELRLFQRDGEEAVVQIHELCRA